MGCQARLWVFLLLVAVVCLHGALSQGSEPTLTRKPFLESLSRLEEQLLKFRRLQESTRSRLEAFGHLRNNSRGSDAPLHRLLQESQGLAQALNKSQAILHGLRETHQSRERAQRPQGPPKTRDLDPSISILVLEVRALQDTLSGLTLLAQSLKARLDVIQDQF